MRYFINGNELSSGFFFEMFRLELAKVTNQIEANDSLSHFGEYTINGITFQIKGE